MRHLTRCAVLLSLLSIAALSVASSALNGGTPKAPFRFYDGPPKPKTEIAILKSRGFAKPRPSHKWPSLKIEGAHLISINGQPGQNHGQYNSPLGGGFYIELPPGAYTLTVDYWIGGAISVSSVSSQTINFTAEAGHEYILDAKQVAKPAIWYPTLDDETAGTRIHP